MKGAKRLHGTSLAMLALSMPPQEARTAVVGTGADFHRRRV